MKQIFDWMREQIKNLKEKETDFLEDRVWNHAMRECENIINEAEAKWEKEFVSLETYKQVAWERDIAIEQLHELGYEFGEKIRECEWKQEKILEFSLSDCVTSCGHTEHYSTGIDKYCRHCGKPIKISEVE